MSKKILIKYSNTAYYKKMLEMIERELKKKSIDVEVHAEMATGFSGIFEIALVKNKTPKMLHSKLTTGKSITIENIKKLIEKINNM